MDIETGEDLDQAVAREVMKQELGPWFRPSKVIYCSFIIVDKMLKDEWSMDLVVGSDGYTSCQFFSSPTDIPRIKDDNVAVCDSPEEAICRAALLVS